MHAGLLSWNRVANNRLGIASIAQHDGFAVVSARHVPSALGGLFTMCTVPPYTFVSLAWVWLTISHALRKLGSTGIRTRVKNTGSWRKCLSRNEDADFSDLAMQQLWQVYMYIYIYIYMYTHTHTTYIYIYMYPYIHILGLVRLQTPQRSSSNCPQNLKHVCMYVCMYVCVYVCMDGWMDGWMYGWMYVCMYVCMYSTVARNVAAAESRPVRYYSRFIKGVRSGKWV